MSAFKSLKSIDGNVFKSILEKFEENVMRSEKPYTKSENLIWRKHELKWFGQKISIFCFQWKYVESVADNMLTPIRVSSYDSMSNYSKKHERYTKNKNYRQIPQCRCQIQFPCLVYILLLSHVMLYAHIAGSYVVTRY